MMGSNDKPQDELFYSFNLDDVVPEDHLLRHIDRFLNFADLREHLGSRVKRPARLIPLAVDSAALETASVGQTAKGFVSQRDRALLGIKTRPISDLVPNTAL